MNAHETLQSTIFSVTQLTNSIKNCLEKTFPVVSLQGEISNFKPHTSGHLYFSLKDANAQIQAVMFRPDAMRLTSLPKDGMQVVVKGEVNVYPQAGRYQILVKEMQPIGLGELLIKLEELKRKLLALGWFKQDRKRPLPKFPKRIGIVTSPTGAAIQDILNVLTRRFSGIHLIINPVKVQGDGAAQEIATAIEQFNAYDLVDVMIVGRGGGSIEDLWAFNEEIVASAIFHSRIPIICAVGHETDHCIAEYVADVRAPTPSAAAELVIGEKEHQLQRLEQARRQIQQTLFHLIRHDKQRLASLTKNPIFATPYGILGPWVQRLDVLKEEIEQSMENKIKFYKSLLQNKSHVLSSLKPAAKLEHYRQRLYSYRQRIDQIFNAKSVRLKEKLFENNRRLELSIHVQVRNQRERLAHIHNILDKVNPKTVLGKGYCILFSEKKNSAITSVNAVSTDDEIKVLMSDGSLKTIVKEVIHS